MRVFVGGSKTLRELPGAARALLRSHMDGGAEVVVGDCFGADALAQRLLAEEGCREVEVYATAGAVRRNEGDWPVREVPVEGRPNRRNADDGYLAHLAKDLAMARVADRGLMAWDGGSMGTFANLLSLVSLGKVADVALVDGAVAEVATFDDIRALLPERRCPRWADLAGVLRRDQIRILDEFVPSRGLAEQLAIRPLRKSEVIDVILGSPTALERKREACASLAWTDDPLHELFDEAGRTGGDTTGLSPNHVLFGVELACAHVRHSTFSIHARAIGAALDALEVGPGELLYHKSAWDKRPELLEVHEHGVAPYASLDAALDDLRRELAEERWDEDAGRWEILEKWRLGSDGAWQNPYTYYAIGDEVVFFDRNSYDKDERRWVARRGAYGGDVAGSLNLYLPFAVGDVVTLDCRPFAPLAHALVLEAECDGRAGICQPWVLARYRLGGGPCDGRWYGFSAKYQGGMRVCSPGYSALYRMDVFDGELPEAERVLRDVQGYLGGDPRRGHELSEALRPEGMSDDELLECASLIAIRHA